MSRTKTRIGGQTGSSIQDQIMLRLPGFLHWWLTGRNLSTRLTEHKRATRNGDVNNHIAEHHLQTKHQINWDSATYITYCTDYYQGLTLESWFTNLEQMPLIVNCSQQLLKLYEQLIDQDQAKLTMTGWLENWHLTNNRRLFNSDNVNRRIKTHQWHYESS